MATTCITTSPFGNFYGEKLKIIGSFLEFGYIGYITKQENVQEENDRKKFKAIIVVYYKNYTRDTYKLYNSETKTVIMTRDVKWVD